MNKETGSQTDTETGVQVGRLEDTGNLANRAEQPAVRQAYRQAEKQ